MPLSCGRFFQLRLQVGDGHLLLDMGEFVGEQLFAGLGLRLVLALVEVDVGFMGEGFRPQAFSDRCRLGVV